MMACGTASGWGREGHEVIAKIEQSVQEKEKGSKNAAASAPAEGGDDEVDELLSAAVEVVLETGQASVSMLQRRLKLGYARAARIVDEMEEKGIVGPFQGSKPRAILITKEQWDAMNSDDQMVMVDMEDDFGVPDELD